jgi:diguanylate cyclase (GGDEF)-like protein/PAS domain S-box-containing protein
VRSYLAMPVVSRTGAVLGALFLGHEQPGVFAERAKQLVVGLAAQAAIALDNARLVADLQASRVELELAYDATIEGWARALDLRDRATEGHSRRVTELCVRLAQALGFSDQELVGLKRGAMLHDIGKMGVPDRILQKPGPLSDEEWVEMRRHPTYAHAMLAQIRFLGSALDIPYCHHEAWDGSGYPRGLKGDQIPFAARIFSAVDIYDALGSDRPYRAAWPEERVRQHLRELAGTKLDPMVVAAFLRLLEQGAPLAVAGPSPRPTGLPPRSRPVTSWDWTVAAAGKPRLGDPARLGQQNAVEWAFREDAGWPRLLIEHISDMLIILEVDGTIRWVGPSVVNVLGFSAEELQGKSLFSITHPDELQASQAALAEFLARPGGVKRLPVRALHKDGSYRHLETVSTNLLDHASFRGLLLSARDVTDRVCAEEALRQSEQRLLVTIRAAAETIFEWNPQTNETRVWENESGKAPMGALPAGCANYFEWWNGRIHPDDLDSVNSGIQTALASEATTWGHEYRFRLNSGSYGWMYSFASIVRDEAGKPLRMVGSMIDITKRKQAEEALRQSEQRLHAIICAADDIIWEWDLPTNRLEMWWNDDTASKLGLELVHLSTLDWWLGKVHPDDLPGMQLSIQSELAGTSRTWQREYRLRCQTGDYTWVHSRANIMRDAAGNGLRAIGSMSDISERKALAAHLEEELARAQSLNHELETKREELASTNRRLAEMAETDSLTGLKNRHRFYEAFEEALERSARNGLSLSVLMLDVDHFKPYNDSFGHLAGDAVLRDLGELLRACLRPYDLAARYGGEEFALILSETDSSGSRQVAERLRAAVESRNWPLRPITISLGAATTTGPRARSTDLLDAADQAMYFSKHRGRNCVTHANDLSAAVIPACSQLPAPTPAQSPPCEQIA